MGDSKDKVPHGDSIDSEEVKVPTGIDFVKINDDESAKKYGIVNTPALVYFRKRTPLVFDGSILKNLY